MIHFIKDMSSAMTRISELERQRNGLLAAAKKAVISLLNEDDSLQFALEDEAVEALRAAIANVKGDLNAP
jgi:hypothetical protein